MRTNTGEMRKFASQDRVGLWLTSQSILTSRREKKSPEHDERNELQPSASTSGPGIGVPLLYACERERGALPATVWGRYWMGTLSL